MTVSELKNDYQIIENTMQKTEINYFDGIMTHQAIIYNYKYINDIGEIMYLPEAIDYDIFIELKENNKVVDQICIHSDRYNCDKMEALIHFFIAKGFYKFEQWDLD